MKIVKLSSAQFDKFASTHKYRNYFQTSEYANVMTKFGYHAQLLGITDDQNSLLGASLIIYKDVFMGNKVAYAPHGILFNYDEKENVKEMVKALKRGLSKQGFMFLRMDPYIPLSIRDYEGNILNINGKGNQILENIISSGFKHKGKNLYFETEKPRWEALVLLQRDIRDIETKLEKRTRNKINKAQNSGIEIVKDTDVRNLYRFVGKKENKPLEYYKRFVESFGNDIDIYYAKINTESYLIHSRRSYEKEEQYNMDLAEKIQDIYIDESEKENYLNKKMESDRLLTSYKNNLLKATDLLKEKPEGIIIAGAMVVRYDNAAYLITEGFDETYGNLGANYLIKWQMINDYNEMHFKYVNLNGIVGNFESQNEYSGVNESKLGFNSTVTEYIGEFDIVLNPFMYNLYKKMNK